MYARSKWFKLCEFNAAIDFGIEMESYGYEVNITTTLNYIIVDYYR